MDAVSTNSNSRSAVTHSIEMVADSLAFGVVFTVALTIVQRGVGFFRSILFCQFMSDQQLGQWSMIFSFLMLLAPFAALGLPGSFARFVEHYFQKGQIGTFLRRVAIVSSLATLLLAGAMFLFPVEFSELIFRSNRFGALVNAMAFTLIAVAASNFLISLIESLRQVRLVAIMRFLQSVIFAVVAIALIYTWENDVVAATLGFGIAGFACSAPAIWFLCRKKKLFSDQGDYLTHSQMWSRIAPFAIWLWASNLVWNMFEVADRYMLIHWSNSAADESHGFVGQYHSARVVPMLLVGVAVVLEGILTPFMTALWEKNKARDAGDQLGFAIKLLAIGFTIGSVAILLLSPLLFESILSGRYNDGLSVLPVTLLYSVWFSLFLFGQIYLWVAEKGKWVFSITISGLVLNLVLNALLIPYLELWGAVVATTLATLVCVVTTYVANSYAENKIEFQVWLASATPLLILLPLPIAVLACVALLLICLFTDQLFSRSERNRIFEKISKIQWP